jgi:hypothetical protein
LHSPLREFADNRRHGIDLGALDPAILNLFRILVVGALRAEYLCWSHPNRHANGDAARIHQLVPVAAILGKQVPVLCTWTPILNIAAGSKEI